MTAPAPRVEHSRFDSPVGPLRVVARAGGLCRIDFHDDAPGARALIEGRLGPCEWIEVADAGAAAAALQRYFERDWSALDALPVAPLGTPFQVQVWLTLRRIPAGRTWSYAELAAAVGRPQASRAVGAANGANPLPLVLPCHRVIGSDGRLVGFGGGLATKAWLLRHEGALL